MSWQDPSQEPATPSLPSSAGEGGKGGGLPARPMWPSIRRGLSGRCPSCGIGKMFRAFLKVADRCAVCGEALHHHRADDAPAYFVILIVGHVVVPLALVVEVAYAPPYWLHATLWLPLTIGLAVGLLQPIKGAIVGWQWANYMHGFDPNAGEAEPSAEPASR
jgi:uncharacterized protein (DUF983 family)